MRELNGNGLAPSIAQAIEEMKAEQGAQFSLDHINLAELERRSGVSRGKLRRLKRNGFRDLPRSTKGRKHKATKLSGYTGLLDSLLRQGVKNSSVVLERLQQAGFDGGATIVKEYIAAHKHLIPAKRQQVAPQGNRGHRYTTAPGEAYQMDWGFTDVLDYNGNTYRAACFAMICHHCGQRYIEFFPNAKQENLFIGMIHAFQYMGMPKVVLTDNMKSVVLHRDLEGKIWVDMSIFAESCRRILFEFIVILSRLYALSIYFQTMAAQRISLNIFNHSTAGDDTKQKLTKVCQSKFVPLE